MPAKYRWVQQGLEQSGAPSLPFSYVKLVISRLIIAPAVSKTVLVYACCPVVIIHNIHSFSIVSQLEQ